MTKVVYYTHKEIRQMREGCSTGDWLNWYLAAVEYAKTHSVPLNTVVKIEDNLIVERD